MSRYLLGETVRGLRKKKGLSQEEVCEDDMDTSTLSRIERGERIPTGDIADKLHDRIDVPDGLVNRDISKEAYERSEIEVLIVRKMARGNYDTEPLIAEYCSSGEQLDTCEQQFYKAAAAITRFNKKTLSAEETLTSLEGAIRLTCSDFRTDAPPAMEFCTRTELFILFTMALAQWETAQHSTRSLQLSSQAEEKLNYVLLQTGMKQHDLFVTLYLRLSVLATLSDWKRIERHYAQSLSFAEEGINLALSNGLLCNLGVLYYNKGFCLCAENADSKGRRYLDNALLLIKYTCGKKQ